MKSYEKDIKSSDLIFLKDDSDFYLENKLRESWYEKCRRTRERTRRQIMNVLK